MTTSNYSEQEINWALEELRKKGVENPTQEDAISLLDTFKEFSKMFVEKLNKTKKSGNSTKEEDNRLN